MDTKSAHKVSWFVVVDRQLLPHTASMRGQWGYEAKCSCGWETKTGGATKSYITGEISFHKFMELGK